MHAARKSVGIVCALASIALALPLAPGAHAAPARAASAASPATASKEAPVDVNSASEQQLMSVPGIGASLAKRIVDFRDKNGKFANVDDLMKVQGIGEKSIEKLRPYLTATKAH
jgi:competence protein ComEA